MPHDWKGTEAIGHKGYTCGYCGHKVGPDKGYRSLHSNGMSGYIYVCPNCTNPTFVDTSRKQVPSVRLGHEVEGITDTGIRTLYNEARDASSVGAHTCAVLIARKILMNLAVQHGAKEGESFLFYVEYLADQGYVPPNGKAWVDKIRTKGNEATHEINVMTEADASLILHFTEMLLRFIYEFPTMLKNP